MRTPLIEFAMYVSLSVCMYVCMCIYTHARMSLSRSACLYVCIGGSRLPHFLKVCFPSQASRGSPSPKPSTLNPELQIVGDRPGLSFRRASSITGPEVSGKLRHLVL